MVAADVSGNFLDRGPDPDDERPGSDPVPPRSTGKVLRKLHRFTSGTVIVVHDSFEFRSPLPTADGHAYPRSRGVLIPAGSELHPLEASFRRAN